MVGYITVTPTGSNLMPPHCRSVSQCGGLLRETGEGTIKTNTHHTPRVHSDDTDEFVRESVRRFFKSLSTRGVFSLVHNGVVCFMIGMSNGYDILPRFQPFPSSNPQSGSSQD